MVCKFLLPSVNSWNLVLIQTGLRLTITAENRLRYFCSDIWTYKRWFCQMFYVSSQILTNWPEHWYFVWGWFGKGWVKILGFEMGIPIEQMWGVLRGMGGTCCIVIKVCQLVGLEDPGRCDRGWKSGGVRAPSSFSPWRQSCQCPLAASTRTSNRKYF